MVHMSDPTHAPKTAAVGVVLGGKGHSVPLPGIAAPSMRAVAVAAAGRGA